MKQIKFPLLIALLIGFINLSNSQTLKTISYGEYDGENGKEYDYIAVGYVNNNQFVENKVLTFLTNRNEILADTIVSGRCFYAEDGNSYIDGIWKEYEFNGKKLKKVIRCKGVFKVSNNKNGIGITTNKKIGEEPIIKTIQNNSYNLEIKYIALKLETSISNLVEQEVNPSIFSDYIKKSEKVKLTFNNGDLFTGTVKEQGAYDDYSADFITNNGEYKYSTGEVANGEIYYSNFYHKFLLYKGSIVFQDGSVENGDGSVENSWLKQYKLSNNEIEAMYRDSKSLTDMRNKAKVIGEERGKEESDKKIFQEQLMEKIRQNKQRLKSKLVAKYGENIGNKILQGKLEAGMTKSMVSDVWKEEYFTVSNIVRNSQNFEVWDFNSGKMAADLIKEYGKEDAYNIYFGLSFASEFGEISIPRKLIFKNDKLTDVYR